MELMQVESPARGRGAPDTWGLRKGDEFHPGLVAQELLGGGKKYEAYLAYDEHRLCLVVAKLVRPSRARDHATLGAMAREFDMLRQLDHPVIARGFEINLTGPHPHVTLEHLEGPRLSTLLRRYGPLPMDQLLPLAMQLCSGLQYMHHCGVLHLDVKPKNVIMSGPPRLIDLSVATTVESAAGLEVPTGTAGYMSPEQQNPTGGTIVGSGADSWGLGATLFEAVTGRLPGSVVPVADRRRAQRQATLPALWEEAVNRCFSSDPSARPSPGELMRQLEPLAAALPPRFPLSPPRPGMARRQ